MTNVYVTQLFPPRSDGLLARYGQPEAAVLVEATSAASESPSVPGGPAGDIRYIDSAEAETVRGFVAVSGTVSSLTLAVHTLQDGAWYWHSDYEFSALTENTSFAIELLGKYTSFHVQVAEITGGGSVAVRVLGVWT